MITKRYSVDTHALAPDLQSSSAVIIPWKMIRAVFDEVAQSLLWIGRKTGLTYNEVNVSVHYLLIPLSTAVMFDFWLRLPVATAAVLLVWARIFTPIPRVERPGLHGLRRFPQLVQSLGRKFLKNSCNPILTAFTFLIF